MWMESSYAATGVVRLKSNDMFKENGNREALGVVEVEKDDEGRREQTFLGSAEWTPNNLPKNIWNCFNAVVEEKRTNRIAYFTWTISKISYYSLRTNILILLIFFYKSDFTYFFIYCF